MHERLRAAGYQIVAHDKSVVGMLRRLEGYEHVLQNPALQRLFLNAQLRKGTAYTVAEMKAIALPRDADFEHLIGTLARQQILQRGYVLNCETCGMALFYVSLHEEQACEGCGAAIQVPVQLDFAFRLNPLWMHGLKNGALTVLLTLVRLSPSEWGAGYRVRGHGHEAELDLVLPERLIECKDSLPNNINDLRVQLERSRQVARQLGMQLELATLQAEIPTAVQDLLAELDVRW